MKLTIVKYENYPKESPHSYAVGFDVRIDTGRGFYIDTLVGYDELLPGTTDEEISALAYKKIAEDIELKVNEIKYKKPSIIGLVFNLSSEGEGIEILDEVEEIEDNSESYEEEEVV